MVRKIGFGIRQTKVYVSALLLASCAIVGKELNQSLSFFRYKMEQS